MTELNEKLRRDLVILVTIVGLAAFITAVVALSYWFGVSLRGP